jgi:chemotaxis protein methyltransferase CheR
MKDVDCVAFLQWALPRLHLRWPGFRKVRRQVCRRIGRRIAELELADLAAYRARLEADPAEWAILDTFCRIPISRLYRDRGVYDYLREHVLPTLANNLNAGGQSVLRCWSAGCASGEEIYTLNIIWKLAVAPQYRDVALRLIATDVDQNMLDRARRGCYGLSSLKDFPKDWLSIAFAQSGDELCVEPQFREDIEFQLQDLRREMPPGMFHLILCRHVAFTYFDHPLQRDVLQRLLAKLAPQGILVTGKQEPLPMQPAELEEVQCRLGIYRKRG